MISARNLLRSTFFAAAVALAGLSFVPSQAHAINEYEAQYYSYYASLFADYVAANEDFYPNDSIHDTAKICANAGHWYSEYAYQTGDGSWFYYGMEYCRLANEYYSLAYYNYGGYYTLIAQQYAYLGYAYGYSAYTTRY